jgi:hypothetical protein
MPAYTIEEIMAVREKYRDKPYPDFSIQNVCRRLAPSTLVRGENAFVAKRATNQEDAVRKTVQGALNRLNEDNYDEVVHDLESEVLLEKGPIRVFVQLAFEKALQEPAYAHIYAKLCYHIARFEVVQSSQAPSQATPSSPLGGTAAPGGAKAGVSAVRNAIIERAQAEFDAKDEFQPPKNVSAEAVEEAYSRFARRKKSNIKFVGQLYMNKVLSVHVILIVVSQLLGTDKASYPSELNIELLIELLDIVGAKMEEQAQECVDEIFERFNAFVNRKPSYPPRIHFKIMDSVDTRNNGWVSRDALRGTVEQTPSHLASKKPTATSKPGAPSPSTGTPTTGKRQMKFPDAPSSPTASGAAKSEPVAAAPPQAAPASKSAGAWKNVLVGSKGAPAAPAAGGKAPAPATSAAGSSGGASNVANLAASMQPATANLSGAALKAVAKKLDEIRATWSTDEAEVDALKATWRTHFEESGLTPEELQAAVVLHVAIKACTTTRSYAQAEAAGFLICGLGFTPSTALPGLTRTFIHAVQEGIIEDAPKFNSRLVRILEDMHRAEATGKTHAEGDELAPLNQPALTAIASNLAVLLLFSLEGLKEIDYMDDLVAEALLPVWKKLPVGEQGGSLDDAVLAKTVVEVADALASSNPLAGVAAAELLASAKAAGWITGAGVGKAMSAAPATNTVVGLLQGKGFLKK